MVKSDPKFDYESILGEYSPRKRKDLVEVANILSKPIFQTGKRRYAVRVYRYTGSVNQGTYQTAVWANNMADLRLKLIRNIPWDLNRNPLFRTNVKIYKTYAIDKYNVAGYLKYNYGSSFVVWDPDSDSPSVRVNMRTGELTQQKYDSDADFLKNKAAIKSKKKRRL